MGNNRTYMERKGSIMKQYIIIALCMLAGKYVDIPIWFNILFGISVYWAVDQLRKVQEEET